jgi:aspartate-semialdehyde dehydrogenase
VTRVAVVGATGAVGREIVHILEERNFPLDELLLFASERSEGKRISFRGTDLSVRALDGSWYRGVDLALTSGGTPLSREIVPEAAKAGTVVVDNSSAFRMDPNAPLVIPEINAHALAQHQGIVANPNCTAITAVMPLGPLHARFGLRSLVTSSYQSASGAGMKGVRELAEQIEKLHGREEELGYPEPESLPVGDVFPDTLAFNVIPVAEWFDPEGSGFTTEELKMGDECRKILDIPGLPVAATAVRVPVAVGHSVAAYATFDKSVTPDAARQVLRAAQGIEVVDDPEHGIFPTPLDAAGRDEVLVGRIRQPKGEPHTLMYFSVADNLRKGAALNAVQIAELL